MKQSAKAWIEATRPRTLPVSVAGVLAGLAVGVMYGRTLWAPAIICLLFALGAQIASNFANEYYDFKSGLDKKGREGFRRGVTEGDIAPSAMKRATYALLALTCALGCSLIWWGGWWLLIPGVLIALFALAYSTGPWPLSRHGLGDVAVIIFFGIVPVMLTAWLQCGSWTLVPSGLQGPRMWQTALIIGTAAGLLAANVLIVNNYRDAETDASVGKKTTVVIFGRQAMGIIYLLFTLGGPCLMALATWRLTPHLALAGWAIFLPVGAAAYRRLRRSRGSQLNLVLASTARLMLLEIAWLWVTSLMAA